MSYSHDFELLERYKSLTNKVSYFIDNPVWYQYGNSVLYRYVEYYMYLPIDIPGFQGPEPLGIVLGPLGRIIQ